MKRIHSLDLLIFFLFACVFSTVLMTRTFWYDSSSHTMNIATKLWSDFGSHIPLIRSFSYGPNLSRVTHGVSPEYPGFPNESIRYHFGFYALAGILERMGIRIDWALNIPSAMGFALLLTAIYWTARTLFLSKTIGILSVIFFLFNGSFSALPYLKTHPFDTQFFRTLVTNSKFPVFGPWDGQSVTAFWHLNIYTNQRHLSLSYGLILIIIWIAWRTVAFFPQKKFWFFTVLLSLCMNMLLFINLPAAGIAGVFLLWAFVSSGKNRLLLMCAGILSIPWVFFLSHISAPTLMALFKPGYLTQTPVTPLSFLRFWFVNFGLHSILIPLGMILSPKSVRKMFIIPLCIVFVIPNIWQFSPDMINNHKFFNFFLIIGNMFSAYVVVRFVRLTRYMRQLRLIPIKILTYLFSLILLVSLTFSGVIDFFAVINDTYISLSDISSNRDSTWFATHTAKDAVILNSTWLYHPANIAGRSVFSGYPYFTWSYGYNKDAREAEAKTIYEASNVEAACKAIAKNRIGFVELTDRFDEYFTPNRMLWGEMIKPVYRNNESGVSVYNPKEFCQMK